MEIEANHDGKEMGISHPWFEYTKSFNDNSTPWSGHKCFGYNLIKKFKPRLVVELGTWKGTSFYSFCQAVKDENGTTKLVAIDTWRGDKHTDTYTDNVFKNFLAILEMYYRDVPTSYLRKTFSEAVNDFQNNEIDILHIDGFHTYEAVSGDFYTWLPKVKSDGIILFHDIAEKMTDFGVYKFWAEIKDKYQYTLEFHHSHGLGILFLDKLKYDLMAQDFESNKLQFFEYAYVETKKELFEAGYSIRELSDIKNSRFWRLKEFVKKLLLPFR